MPSANFTGVGLHLESVTLLGTSTLRVKFTQDPLASSSSGANDALNLANYNLTGPGTSYFSVAHSVGTDPQSIDLTIGLPLVAGTWTLSVANIETAQGDTLEAPTSMDFVATAANPQQPVSGGGTNDSAFDILKKHMGGGLALDEKGWDSFLRALSSGDQYVFDTAAGAFNQRFVSTASDIYLSYLGSAKGVSKPPNLGMSDDLYRQFVIKLTTGKLTEESFLELLEIFYGIDSVHGQVTSTFPEPFALANGDTLQVLINERQAATVTFSDSDFEVPGVGTSNETAAAITRNFEFQGINAYAVPVQDSVTGRFKVRIYSGARGLRSTVRVQGGPAQNIFQFPTLRSLSDTSTTWSVGPVSGQAGVSRYTTVGPTTVDLASVVAGDYVTVYGPNFAPGNRGTFVITDVYVYYNAGVLTQAFDVVNSGAITQGSVAVAAPTDLVIYAPTKASSFTTAGRSVTVSSGADEVDIVIPATTQAVQRTVGTAAYLQSPTTLIPSKVERRGDGTVRLTISGHGLTESTTGVIDGVAWNGTLATINAGTPSTSGNPGTSPSSLGAGPLSLRAMDSAGAYNRHLVLLADNRILIAGGTTATAPLAKAQVMSLAATTPAGDDSLPYTYNYLPATPITWTGRGATSKPFLLPFGPNTDKVIFIGGATNASGSGTYTNSTDLFDPAGPSFASGPTMSVARGQFGAAMLASGDILVSGGKTTNVTASTSQTAEIYSATGNSWSSAASMASNRDGHTLTTLTNGTVLAAGGAAGTAFPIPGCELYSVSGNTWSAAGNMCIPRRDHFALLLPDGRVMVLGGTVTTPNDTRNAAVTPEFYDSVSGRWQLGVSSPFSLATCRAYLDSANHRVVVYSGTADSVAYYDYVANRWSMGTAVPTSGGMAGSLFHAATGLTVLAGGNATTPNSQCQLINANNLSTAATGLSSGELNGLHLLTVADGNTLSCQVAPGAYYVNTNSNQSIGVTIGTAGARQWIGPYSFNTVDGIAVTDTTTATTATYALGGQYALLEVADTSDFPDEPGYVCVGFGYNYQVPAVPYLGVLDPTHLILDFSFRFTAATPVGASVTLLSTKGPYVPTSTEAPAEGSLYVTESAAGRLAAQGAIAEAAAAGVNVSVTVTYPGDRGLGGEGDPTSGNYKLSDIVEVFAGDEIDDDVETARES
jgi:hypothetical protein